MLGQYVHVQHQAQQAISLLVGKINVCTYPLFYCQAGEVVGYSVDAYRVPTGRGQKQKQTFYFDADWQPLAVAPANARPCCIGSAPHRAGAIKTEKRLC